jgi:hypothetical protein
MSDSWGAYDGNDKWSLTAVSSVDDKTIVRLVADPITGALLVSASGLGNTFVYNEVVAGSGTSWTLATAPVSGMQAIYANGQRLTPTVDYTIVGSAITTVSSWAAGTLLADYQHT